MDDRDLALIRAFRADEAQPPIGLQARIEEDVWRAVLAEEATRAKRRSRSGTAGWFGGRARELLRPAVAAGAAMSLAVVVAIASDGGPGATVTPASGVQEAGVLDSAAITLFGQAAAPAATGVLPAGSIDVRESSTADGAMLTGPVQGEQGPDGPTIEVISGAPRDPSQLLDTLRAAAASYGVNPSDRVVFEAAMRWVVHPAVPSELRAAMLRSVQAMAGLDPAQVGSDVLGRRGLVIGHLDSASGVRVQYVLNQDGGTLLERRAYMAVYVDPACPPGTFVDHAVYQRDQRLDPADAQYLNWPQVVEACAPDA